MSLRGKSVVVLMIVALLLVAAVGCGGNKGADGNNNVATPETQKMSLKVGHVLAPDHPYQIGLEKFAELVKEKTDGLVTVDVFHSSQLGNEREAIEGVQMGTLDMTLVSTAPLAGFSNAFLVFDLPFIFQSRDHAYAVLDGPIGQNILKDLEKNGILGLGYWENGFRNLTNSKREVVVPSDAAGLKIRTMENKIHMASFRTIGADPTPMAFGELFTALQQGTVDGQENPIPIIYTSNFFEVQKYLSLTGHFYAAAPLLINKALFDKMTPEVQNAILEAAIEARDFERSLVAEMNTNLLGEIKAKGMIVTEVDKDVWLEAMQPVYAEFENEIGADLIDAVLNYNY